jgi:hypothetical protein
MPALHEGLSSYPKVVPLSASFLRQGGVSYSGSPPSAWKAKGELDAVLSLSKEGVVLHRFYSPSSSSGRGGQGVMVAPVKNKVEFSWKTLLHAP